MLSDIGSPAAVRRDFEALAKQRMQVAKLSKCRPNGSRGGSGETAEGSRPGGLKEAGQVGPKPRLSPADLRKIRFDPN